MNDSSGLPTTMRAAVLYDVDDIRIEERPVPALEPGDLLVATAASGVCSGDLMPWYVRRKAPFVFGHEPAGTVVAMGVATSAAPGGSCVALGDRVFAHHHAPCLRCEACAAGRFVHCATWRSTALEPGGMAEFFRVPRANLADTRVLPSDVSFADGSLVEPLACVVKSLHRAFPSEVRRPFAELADAGSRAASIGTGEARSPALEASSIDRTASAFAEREIIGWPLSADGSADAAGCLAGATLYVIGAGVMGLMHVAVARSLGARVFVSDFQPARRAAALELGAERAFEPGSAAEDVRDATDGRLPDAVVCGPGHPAALAVAVDAVRADGTVVMFTPIDPDERFAFDQSRAYFRDIRLVASYSCGPDDTAEALALIARGVVSADRLGATSFAFPAVAEAYAAMQRADIIKGIVTFSH